MLPALFYTAILTVAWLLVFYTPVRLPFGIGMALEKRHRFKQAVPWFRFSRSFSRFVRWYRSESWTGVTAWHLCHCHLNLGNYEAARRYGEEAVKVYAGTMYLGNIQAMLGSACLRLQQYRQAQDVLERALASSHLDPRYRPMADLYLAYVNLHEVRFDEAEGHLHAALTGQDITSEYRAAALDYLSVCHFYRDRLAEALEDSRQAEEIGVTYPEMQWGAWVNRMVYLAENGQIAEARGYEAKLLPLLAQKQGHDLAALLRSLARLALRAGELDRARDYAERAYPMDADPDSQASALLLQAEVFAARHNAPRAEALCAEILRLDTIDYFRRRVAELRQRLETAEATQ
jgi:tetratricopeptide (TPR) repeat protein